MIGFTLAILACFLLGDLVRRFGAPAEVSRKSVHVSSCLVIAAFPLFGIGYRELFWIAAGSFAAIALLRGTVLLRSIMGVERQSYGDLLLPLSLMVATSLDLSYPAFVAAYLVLGISDALAGVIGETYGRRRYTLFGHAKSYAGSAAFFLSGLAILVPAALWMGLPPAAALSVAMALGAALTLIEAFSHKGTDNLFLPLIAAISLQSLLSVQLQEAAVRTST
ncbi:diacylglycerol/polyprenol kinase family protein [Lysobacter antibioticus]|uniref:diacylglycerol/polyprenol kinase family protein n=1 Tax=Lysobacter antibioticus TaxID=84531 RepID=UPI0003467D3D|nr:hypothetical protein [Lysobacter antibioticus]